MDGGPDCYSFKTSWFSRVLGALVKFFSSGSSSSSSSSSGSNSASVFGSSSSGSLFGGISISSGGGGSSDNLSNEIDNTLFSQYPGRSYVFSLNLTEDDKNYLRTNSNVWDQISDFCTQNKRVTKYEKEELISQQLELMRFDVRYANAVKTEGFYKMAGYMDKCRKAGLDNVQYGQLVRKSQLLQNTIEILESGLQQQDKNTYINELISYLETEDFQESLKKDISKIPNSNGDPQLDFNSLSSNPNFDRLTTNFLRTLISQVDPNLEEWKRNISAGRALEEAFSKFVSAGDVIESNFRKGFKYPIPLDNNRGTRWIIPDFIHPTNWFDPSSNHSIDFPVGGVVEVKASQNPITLKTSNNQIEAEIKWAATATEECYFNCNYRSGNYKAGSYTLVLPYGATYDQGIVNECTTKGVNFYVIYAFIERSTNKVVFSNPEKKNSVSNELPYIMPATINKTITLDISGAIQRWKKSNNQWDE